MQIIAEVLKGTAWVPAVDGPLNQTGQPPEMASRFESVESAEKWCHTFLQGKTWRTRDANMPYYDPIVQPEEYHKAKAAMEAAKPVKRQKAEAPEENIFHKPSRHSEK